MFGEEIGRVVAAGLLLWDRRFKEGVSGTIAGKPESLREDLRGV
jgi:hypothetical protein